MDARALSAILLFLLLPAAGLLFVGVWTLQRESSLRRERDRFRRERLLERIREDLSRDLKTALKTSAVHPERPDPLFRAVARSDASGRPLWPVAGDPAPLPASDVLADPDFAHRLKSELNQNPTRNGDLRPVWSNASPSDLEAWTGLLPVELCRRLARLQTHPETGPRLVRDIVVGRLLLDVETARWALRRVEEGGGPGSDRARQFRLAYGIHRSDELHPDGGTVIRLADGGNRFGGLLSPNGLRQWLDEAGARFWPGEPIRIVAEAGPEGFLLSDPLPLLGGQRLGLPGEDLAPGRGLLFRIGLLLFCLATLVGGGWLILRTGLRERELATMKADFVSRVSHELRTPLTGIRASAELLASGRLTDEEKVQSYADRIEADARRLCDLVDGVLNFAAGRAATDERESVPVATLVREAVSDVRERAREKGLSIQVEGDEELRMTVAPSAMRRAVTNLLANAVNYSPEDGEPIRVTWKATEEELRLAVADRGRGIPTEDRTRIFQPFERGEGTTEPGTGLGLAILKEIVEAHEGRVELESEIGRGSRFVLVLPHSREEET